MSKNKKKKMKKKQKKQAELLEKKIQEMEGGATQDAAEEEDEEETTEATEDTTSSVTLASSSTLQDIVNHVITGRWLVWSSTVHGLCVHGDTFYALMTQTERGIHFINKPFTFSQMPAQTSSPHTYQRELNEKKMRLKRRTQWK